MFSSPMAPLDRSRSSRHGCSRFGTRGTNSQARTAISLGTVSDNTRLSSIRRVSWRRLDATSRRREVPREHPRFISFAVSSALRSSRRAPVYRDSSLRDSTDARGRGADRRVSRVALRFRVLRFVIIASGSLLSRRIRISVVPGRSIRVYPEMPK